MVQHLVGKEVLRKCVFPAPLCAQGELTARRLPSFTERGGAAGGQRKGEEELGNLLLLYLCLPAHASAKHLLSMSDGPARSSTRVVRGL